MLHAATTPANAAAAEQQQPKGKAKAKAKNTGTPAEKQEAMTLGGAIPSSPTAVVDKPDLVHQGNGEGKRG